MIFFSGAELREKFIGYVKQIDMHGSRLSVRDKMVINVGMGGGEGGYVAVMLNLGRQS